MESKWKIRGREISAEDVKTIREMIAKHYNKGRKHISREICHCWKWYQSIGHTKDRACRDILLFLEKEGLIKLPPRMCSSNNKNRKVEKIELEEVHFDGTVKDHRSIELRLLSKKEEYKFWNRVIESYHYQGHQVIVGQSLKYMAYIEDKPVACIGWGSSAWSLASRDKWIGWNKEEKDRNLAKVVNNIRFLILPWVQIKYLASHLLSLSIRRIGEDWQQQFGNQIYLLETFVEQERFKGTCYRASNWQYLGYTKGSAKRGNAHNYHGNIKDVYVYPLCKDFRKKLKGGV